MFNKKEKIVAAATNIIINGCRCNYRGKNMNNITDIAKKIRGRLGMEYYPVGLYYSKERPADSLRFKEKGNGCIMPLVLSAAKGKTVSVDADSTGWNCSAFYFGYSEWIFEGIEYYLSDGLETRECEKFVKDPAEVKKYLESLRFKEPVTDVTVLKPLENFAEGEKPEVVIFFVNADQLSALTYLVYFNSPLSDDRIVTRFASACAAAVTLPLKYRSENKYKAVIGMNDISARLRLPKDLMTLSMPVELFEEICSYIDECFFNTTQWKRILERNIREGAER